MILHAFLLMLIAASLFSLLAVSIDRCWAICWPVSYRITGASITKLMVVSCWILGMIFGFSPTFWQESVRYKGSCDHSVLAELNPWFLIHVSAAALLAMVIITLYAFIYRTIAKHVRRLLEVEAHGNLSILSF